MNPTRYRYHAVRCEHGFLVGEGLCPTCEPQSASPEFVRMSNLDTVCSLILAQLSAGPMNVRTLKESVSATDRRTESALERMLVDGTVVAYYEKRRKFYALADAQDIPPPKSSRISAAKPPENKRDAIPGDYLGAPALAILEALAQGINGTTALSRHLNIGALGVKKRLAKLRRAALIDGYRGGQLPAIANAGRSLLAQREALKARKVAA